ncbi:hypothetical protein [Pseudomonas kurunegalensis]|uniref:hypothetical protein n=1 Tax=Pseudomonas kurunegalensis TaxID=485880 RepID=UPI00236488A0|nr:hypothetical protein [Pseudomonas kurunegalensis]
MGRKFQVTKTHLIGMTGGVFNALGNTAGIVTPVVIGYLLHSSGSFNSALIYVGAHGLLAAFSYPLRLSAS